jgi:hypothetical protein
MTSIAKLCANFKIYSSHWGQHRLTLYLIYSFLFKIVSKNFLSFSELKIL